MSLFVSSQNFQLFSIKMLETYFYTGLDAVLHKRFLPVILAMVNTCFDVKPQQEEDCLHAGAADLAYQVMSGIRPKLQYTWKQKYLSWKI